MAASARCRACHYGFVPSSSIAVWPNKSESRQRVGPWVAYAAALWASVFAAFHIICAAGWYPLLDAEPARVAFATPWNREKQTKVIRASQRD